MVHISNLSNGRYVGIAVAEVTAVPYYELLHSDPERAGEANQALFSRLLTGLHSRVVPNSVALELLWHSRAAEGERTPGRVHQYLILRQMGFDAAAIRTGIENLLQSVVRDLTGNGYSLSFAQSAQAMEQFTEDLSETDDAAVLALGKRERLVPNMFYQGGLYCTEAVKPAWNRSIGQVTNLLSQHPRSAVSVQLIPTQYNQDELAAFEQGQRFLNYSVTAMRFRQGGIGAELQSISDSFEYYAASEREPLFYTNFLVYSRPGAAMELAEQLAACIEETRPDSGALETVDVSSFGLRPDKKLAQAPWAISNILIYKQRQAFRNPGEAPQQMLRLKYLMTGKEALGAFRLPIDDGRTLGLVGNKLLADAKQDPLEPKKRDLTPESLSGKSAVTEMADCTPEQLLQFWQKYRIPFLVVESEGHTYRALAGQIPELRVLTPGNAAVCPWKINPFLPAPGVTAQQHAAGLTEAFRRALPMAEPLPEVFSAAVSECCNLYGWQQGSVLGDPGVQAFGLAEFIRVLRRRIRNMDCPEQTRAEMENTGVLRLVSLLERRGDVFDTLYAPSSEDLISGPVVMELNALDREEKQLLTGLVLNALRGSLAAAGAPEGTLRQVLVLEEAPEALLDGLSGTCVLLTGPAPGEKESPVSDASIARFPEDRQVPYYECAFAGCGSCPAEQKADTDFIAARLASEYAQVLRDEESLLRFLVQMDPAIRNVAEQMGLPEPTAQLSNCVKIKFLRRAMLARCFRFSKADYDMILSHPRFLKKM